MFTLITVSLCLCLIALTGWTITIYLVKEDSQEVIKEELKNLFDISKMFYISLKSLIEILAEKSLSSESSERNPIVSNELNEHPLNLVQPVKEVQSASLKVNPEEDDDIALSSFSPEVVKVIEEEEEKLAS